MIRLYNCKPDQFVHKYQYDADNRLTSVFTSTDRFMWNQEASYYYYKHGPLARVELGAYRSQGQDYYYTLQGWIKGVNQPYGDQNAYDNNVGKDVYAYALGYYENDYKPINSSLTTTDARDQLWTRLNETHKHKGLYNGNISWMVTDLTKIGEVTNDRSKGIQAMLYKYDQLHRITKSRSLTSYIEGTGFAARTTTPAPYDETYTYDANGNILTLNRMNGEGALMDDFNYKYYGGTNKLRGVKPITRDTIFNGTVNSPDKLYRNITLQGGALAANGNSATLKATELVAMNPSFAAEEGTDFAAYIPEEGPYIYDAIGNLVADEDEGVKISWTPYGKIREVKTNNDSVTVKFRYDGTGNRIEKRVVKYDTTLITRYVRDASGNVMTIYNDTTVSEQPIYGSARLGMYKGSVQDGHQTLGRRSYELSNHLGNVLAVITDNIGMNTQDTVWASVESSSDYYAFGMGMKERSYSSGSYRYGFNGKEKDDKEVVNYDFGARVFNSKIGRFLSVDLYNNTFSHKTGYDFAGNSPIKHVDFGGNFKIDAFFAKQYPTLAKMIEHYLPMLKDNPDVRKGFMEVTGFTEAQFNEMVSFGSGPWISPTSPELANWMEQKHPAHSDDSNYNPKYANGLYQNNIFISAHALQDLEQSMQVALKTGNAEEVAIDMFMVSVKIMHEATHYGIYKNLGPKVHDQREGKGDQGALWERKTYRQFSYKSVDHLAMDREDVKDFYKNNLNSVNRIGMTLSERKWFNRSIIKNSPATEGQEGDPSVAPQERTHR